MTRAVVAVLVILLAGAGVARAEIPEKRIALVIGNGDYRVVKPQLANPAADARDIGRALQAVGFETTVKTDVGRRDLYALIDAFAARIAGSPDTVGLFYYAGHGVQMEGKNYLVPVDADLRTDSDLEAEAVDAGKVLRAMDQARNRLNIVILDACRDNPLARGRSLARGLAQMDAPRGTFIAYAAAPGQSAADGDPNSNGVFTGALIKQIAVPGQQIEEVFKQVIAGVAERTGGKQIPWSESSLQGHFYFSPPGEPTPALAARPAPPRSDRDLAFWQSIEKSADPADFADFLQRFPDSEFATLAKRRLEALKSAKVVAAAPAEPPAAAAAERRAELAPSATADPRETTRALQTELRRVGCYVGAIDGDLGPATAAAIQRFNQRAGKRLDIKVASADSVAAVHERTDRVCPPTPVVRRQPPAETVSRETTTPAPTYQAPSPSYQAPTYQAPSYQAPAYGGGSYGGQSYGRGGY